jgi:hypothetical protein
MKSQVNPGKISAETKIVGIKLLTRTPHSLAFDPEA